MSVPPPKTRQEKVRKLPATATKRGKRTTLKDIAEAVGVSINTVSAVLNERSSPARVGDSTRREIEEVARRLGYRRNTAASLLAGGRTKTLGILLENLSNSLAAPMAEAFEQEAARRGYQCFLGCTQYDGLRRIDYIERFLSHSVEGLMLIGVWLDPDVEVALNSALSSNTAVVTVDIPWTDHDVPVICGNHFMGGRILAEHLLEVGHRNILYLSPPDVLHFDSIQERILGMRSVIENRPDLACEFEVAETPGRGLTVVSDVLLPRLRGDKPPTVVAAGHDLHAFRVITALAEQGVQVPRDVAVVGYDDIQYDLLWSLGVE
ncbi:MAG: LacI family DNA-binding transcriptional regulator, partial [Candidatus Omnitrophica bacterium]|nr:LacI family DNA-binding transcriptional regulator [Candidatus Omnitrophota bacterium]